MGLAAPAPAAPWAEDSKMDKLDFSEIKAIHEADKWIVEADIDASIFPDITTALLVLERAHQHRGLLLAEVERLSAEFVKAQEFQKTIRENQELILGKGT